MDCKILLAATLLATFVCKSEGKLVVKPRDTDVKVSHSTYLNCSTDYVSTAIFWFHGKKYVYTGTTILEPYNERFEINRNTLNGTHVYNLVIHSVQPEDVGEYICAEDEGFGERYSVQLVVLEVDPICRSNKELDKVIGQNTCNIEPDKVELECSVRYHGNIPPQMEWKKVGEEGSTKLDTSTVISTNHLVSTLNLKGDVALNNSSFVCETSRTTQTSIMCITEVMKILYAVSGNSTVTNIMNDEIHCNANTSQSCSYRWTFLQDNDFTIESPISILKARKPGWHRCEAECYLRNISCNLLVMKALIHYDPGWPALAFMIPIVIMFILTITTTILCCRRRNRQRFKNSKIAEEKRGLLKELPAINGIAVLGEEVFIARERYVNIAVYDSKSFDFKRNITVDGMIHAEPIVSCSEKKCLYTFVRNFEKALTVNLGNDPAKENYNFRAQTPFNAVLRIDPSNGKLVKDWEVVEGGGRLSVANDTNVILNINYEAKLHEYTADGELIRVIDLALGTGILRAWHAVKLPNGLFVICQGCKGDPVNRVCLLSTKTTTSTDGRVRIDEVIILKEFGGEKGEQRLYYPMYLSTNKKESILVSDINLVLLSSDLHKPRILIEREVTWLWSTCFDESTRRWFVTGGNRIMVFQEQDEQIIEQRLGVDLLTVTPER